MLHNGSAALKFEIFFRQKKNLDVFFNLKFVHLFFEFVYFRLKSCYFDLKLGYLN